MDYVVYGAGAVGGVIGGLLHRAGRRTTLIARGEHLAALRERGLTLDTPAGVDRLVIPTARTAAEVSWTDQTVVLLCVKSHQTAAALDDLVAHAPGGTAVVSAQNGVANERSILRRFAAAYGICVMLPASHLEPGIVIQGSSNAPGILDIGRYPGGTDSGIDAVADAVAADLRAAGFASEPRADIMAWKYRKLVMNLGNGIDALTGPGPAADELYRRAEAEGEAAIAAAGIPIVSEADNRVRRGDLIRGRHDRPKGSSTWQSLARGADGVEIDYLAGEVVLLGRLHGVPTPVNELVQRSLHELVRSGQPAGSVDAESLLARL